MSPYIKTLGVLAALLLVLIYYQGAQGLATTGGGVFSTVWRAITGQNAAGTAAIGYAK